MKIKLLIVIFITSAVLVIAGYYGIFKYQMGRSVTAEWWVVNVQDKKEQISNDKKSNRIIFLAGFNGLFGLNSHVISNITGKNAINLAMHASLDISYYRMLLEKNIKDGDIVILPLEYEYYFRQNAYSEWFINNMLAWGGEYLSWLPIDKKIEFASHVSALRVIEGVMASDKEMFVPKNVIHKYEGNVSNKNYGYNYTTLTQYGDMNIHTTGETYSDKLLKNIDNNPSSFSYAKSNRVISEYALSELNKIKEIVKKHNGSLYITWPVTMKTKYFNESDPESIEFTDNIRNQLNKNGFNTICNNFYANIPSDLFFDSVYHPNSEGSDL
ncbi:hypothetical protein LJP28_004617, partial [Salmonella enterica]|nr:hypothetical protein [Salmonella enterica]